MYFFNCYVCIELKDPPKAPTQVQPKGASQANATTTTTTTTTSTTSSTTTTIVNPLAPKTIFPCDIVYEDNIQVMNFNKPFPREFTRFSMKSYKYSTLFELLSILCFSFDGRGDKVSEEERQKADGKSSESCLH